MSKIISFLSQKGGTGKTTLSILSATYLASVGTRVAVIDADFPQHSFNRTRKKDILDLVEKQKLEQGSEDSSVNAEQVSQKLPYAVVSSTISDATNSLKILQTSQNLDFIFVDVPGTLNVNDMVDLVDKLDLIIIPTEMEFKSITAGMETMAIIRKINPNVPMGLIWTKLKKQHRVAERQAYEEYIKQKQPTCHIFNYVLYETVKVSQLLNTLTPQPDVIKPCVNEMGSLLLSMEHKSIKSA